MLRHIWEFVVAIIQRWGVLTTGGFLVALIGLWEHLSGRPIAGWPLWIAVALSLVSACFSAWRKERLTVETLNAQIVPLQRRKEVRDHLSRLLKAKDKFVSWLTIRIKYSRWATSTNGKKKRANIYERTLVKLMKSFSWTQRVSRSRQSIHGKTDEQSSLAGCIIARINSEKF